jgi:hypothetical protein
VNKLLRSKDRECKEQSYHVFIYEKENEMVQKEKFYLFVDICC